MVKFIKPLRAKLFNRGKQNSGQDNGPEDQPGDNVSSDQELQNLELGADLQANLLQIKSILSDCSDVVYREFDFAQDGRIKLAIVYMDGMADKIQISAQVLRSLMLDAPLVEKGGELTGARAFKHIKKKLLPIQQVEETTNLGRVIDAVLAGACR